jgi:MFS transporter, UMF1 family
MSKPLNDKKVIRAWTMYDWANSVFSLTIATAIFPPYYEAMSKSAAISFGSDVRGPYYIDFLGFKLLNSALYSYALSLGFLLVTILTPLLSGIADAKGNKKTFLKLFCYIGSAACALMYFFTADTLFLGLLLFVIALVGFGGSIVYYNAFLPEIASEDQFDRISARGFSMGYIGSVLLLVMDLMLIMNPQWFFAVEQKATELAAANAALTPDEALQAAKSYYEGIASRLSFVSVGVWWAAWAQIPFKHLPNGNITVQKLKNPLAKGFEELKKVWREINTNNTHSHIKRYLWGFFFTSMGLQTVMYVATIFGSQELRLKTAELIVTVLIIQLIAIVGAWLFARVSEKIGNIYSLLIMVAIWIGICAYAYGITTANQFYGLAIIVGFVMGGIQSMFRSTYAKIIPDETPNHASYFSFYDACEKLAIVLGTFSYGFLLQLTGNMRASILALALYFIVGLFFIARIKNFKSLHP